MYSIHITLKPWVHRSGAEELAELVAALPFVDTIDVQHDSEPPYGTRNV
jgi:hypothetical protein